MTTNPESLLAVTQAKAITAEILGYKDWDDATDYRTTGAQDRERDRVLAIVSKALATRPAPPAQPGREEVVEILVEALRPFAERQTIEEALADPKAPIWANATPERRIEMMGERKREHDGQIVRARTAIAAAEPLLARQDTEPASAREKMIVDFLRERAGSYDADGNEGDIFALVSAADAIERGDHRAALAAEPLLARQDEERPTMDAYLRVCRAHHWHVAQLRANGIEPDPIADDAPHYPPEDHVFTKPASVREERLREAAEEVLTHRVGDLPGRGWLRDNDASRAALARLAAALSTEEPKL